MRKIKLMEQTTPTECGLCCLYMILEYLGIRVNFFQLKNKVNVGRNGLYLKDIKEIALTYGVVLKTYRINSLTEKSCFPLMIYLKDNHFILLEKIKKGKYKILDPAIGKYTLDEREFLFLKPVYYTAFDLQGNRDIRGKRLKRNKNNIRDIFKIKFEYLLYSLILSIIFQIITITTPFVIRWIIDNKEILSNLGELKIIIMLIGIVFFQCCIYFYKSLFINLSQTHIHFMLANNLVKKISDLSIGEIFKIDKSDILYRYNGATIARELFSERIVSMWFDLILAVSAMIFVGIYSFKLFILLLLVLILEITLYIFVMQIKQEKLGKEVLEQKRSLEKVFSLVDSLYVLKSNNAHIEAYEKWVENFKQYMKAIYERNKLFSHCMSFNSFFTIFLPIAVVIYCIYSQPDITSGNLLLLYLMTLNFITPLNKILTSIDEIDYELKYLEKITEFCSLESEMRGTYKLSKSDILDIKLENVSYKYGYNSEHVLKNISLKIKNGEFVSIIGKSGCGKSTLGKIILGYEEVTEGVVSYNNKDIRNVDKKDFRNLVSLITQDAPILDGSIDYNITLNRKNIKTEDLKNVLKSVDLYEEVVRMPMKFKTPLRRDNTKLSGGQGQRIALAREIVSNPKVLVLDEPTSALDIVTEKIVQKNIEKLNCTRILITHRLNTIMKSDRIIILDEGKIVGSGTHNDLYMNNKNYKRMFDCYMNNKEI